MTQPLNTIKNLTEKLYKDLEKVITEESKEVDNLKQQFRYLKKDHLILNDKHTEV